LAFPAASFDRRCGVPSVTALTCLPASRGNRPWLPGPPFHRSGTVLPAASVGRLVGHLPLRCAPNPTSRLPRRPVRFPGSGGHRSGSPDPSLGPAASTDDVLSGGVCGLCTAKVLIDSDSVADRWHSTCLAVLHLLDVPQGYTFVGAPYLARRLLIAFATELSPLSTKIGLLLSRWFPSRPEG
jgi:hypothetical protein